MSRPLRVFLCHASQDKPAVRKLHRYLKQHGIEPWLDEMDLLPGENWEVEIPEAIKASDVILVCLSKSSVNKEGYVQKEISFALDKALEKPEGTIFIIPAKLEDCEVPKRLNHYQWVDLFRPDSNKRLLLGLNKRVLSLGSDVSLVNTEEQRQKTSIPNAARPRIKKQEVQDTPNPSSKDLKKDIPAKPFTKILDPTSLSSKKATFGTGDKKNKVGKQIPGNNVRWFGIAIFVFIVFLLVFWGRKFLFNNLSISETPIANVSETISPPISTITKIPLTNTPTLTSTPGIGSLFVSDKTTMLYVPAGTFSMGGEKNDDEKPIHAVNLNAYYIDQFEVTNASYEKCVDAGVCSPPTKSNSSTRTAYYGNPQFDDYPVIYVNWSMAKTYCEWRDTRLPTEAEWEKAARGEDGRTYPWGEGISCSKANYESGCVGDTTKVGSYLEGVSPYGLYDMTGNVWEWVNDWYSNSYYQISPSSNPLGPNTGQSRVLRGGSWNLNINNTRSAYRGGYDPAGSYNYFGFRCALTP